MNYDEVAGSQSVMLKALQNSRRHTSVNHKDGEFGFYIHIWTSDTGKLSMDIFH